MANKAKFDFDKNIIEFSENKNTKEAIKEWIFIRTVINKQGGRCICNHPLIKENYFYNFLNGNVIIAGDTCKDKIVSNIKKKKNKELLFIFEFMTKGEYSNINIETYSDENKQKLIDHYKNEINSIYVIDELEELYSYINELNIGFLEDICNLISEKIETLKIERREHEERRCREREERRRREHEERRRRDHERYLNNIKINESKEKQWKTRLMFKR